MSFVNKIMSLVSKSGSDGRSDVPDDSGDAGADDFDYSTIDNCPRCGDPLQGWGCVSCRVEYVLEDDKLVERDLSGRGRESERRCVGCDTPMSRSSALTAPWEDGDNADGYIICSSCGYQNTF